MGKSVFLIISSLMAVFFQPSCSNSSVRESTKQYLGCDNISPSAYYMMNEFRTDNPPDQLEVFSRLRNFDPNETLEMYSDEDLVCWSRKLDPIADYLVASKDLSSSNILVIDDDLSTKSPSPMALNSLRRASGVRQCLTDADREILFCDTGLPEAEYLLSIILSQESGEQSISRELLDEAASKGLFVADQLRQSQ